MDVYIYQASLYCKKCGDQLCEELPKPEGMDLSNRHTWDSDDYPKGPYPRGGGESDNPHHCDGCGKFLENDLTEEGEQYVLEKVNSGYGNPEVLETWKEFYSYLFEDDD